MRENGSGGEGEREKKLKRRTELREKMNDSAYRTQRDRRVGDGISRTAGFLIRKDGEMPMVLGSIPYGPVLTRPFSKRAVLLLLLFLFLFLFISTKFNNLPSSELKLQIIYYILIFLNFQKYLISLAFLFIRFQNCIYIFYFVSDKYLIFTMFSKITNKI